MIDVSFLTSDVVMSSLLAFFVGMGSVMVYSRITSLRRRTEYHADDALVEAVIGEYTRRLQAYDKAIADLRVQLDIVELRASQPVTREISQHHAASQAAAPHALRVSEPVTITQHATAADIDDRLDGQNGTIDYILRLLSERPRSAREVQQAIGRSREHTSRLMKKLHDSGLVVRNVETKPFKYSVTSLGQARLREKVDGEGQQQQHRQSV